MSKLAVAVVVAPGESAPPGLEHADALASVQMVDDPGDASAALDAADVVFVWDFRTTLIADAGVAASSVPWFHAGSIGVDAILAGRIGDRALVTNTRGVFERPIAEYTLAMLLMFAKDLETTLALKSRRSWRHRETRRLGGTHLLVLGAGPVGREIASLAKAFSVTVDLVGRTKREDPTLGRVYGIGDLDELLPRADAIAVALPLTDETRRLIDRDFLARVRDGVIVVNVGRGALIDESALIDALHAGRVANAALDVFDDEPLPSEHPFWDMPHVVVSPHMAGDTVGWREEVVAGFVANLRRFVEGEALAHVVPKDRLRPLLVDTARDHA